MESSDALSAFALALITIICAVGVYYMPSRGQLSKSSDIPSVSYVIPGIGSALGFAWDQLSFFDRCRYVLRHGIH